MKQTNFMNYRYKLSQTYVSGLFALLFVCSIMTVSADAQIEPTAVPDATKVIAKVNGQPIYQKQVDSVIKARFGESALQADKKKSIELQKIALNDLVNTEVIYQEAQKTEIPDIEIKIKELTKTFKNHPLGHYKNKTDEDLRNMAKRQIYAAKYFEDHKLYEPEIPEEDIKDYYNKNKSSFATDIEAVQARHIFVSLTESMSTEEKKHALEKINKAKEELDQGGDFSELAATYSEDISAAKGGDLGVVKKGFMPKEFDAIAFTIEPHKPSPIVTTSFGYHILIVDKFIPKGTPPSYENMRDFFKTFLQKQKSQEVITTHVAALVEKSDIEFFIDK